MKNKQLAVLLMSAVMVFSATGCSAQKEAEDDSKIQQETSKEKQSTTGGQTIGDKLSETAKTKDAANKTDIAGDGADQSGGQTVGDSVEGNAGKTGNREGTENNGGYFVRVKDDVYFRAQSIKGLEPYAIWGEFMENNIVSPLSQLDLQSDLMKMNLDTMEVTTFAVDNGYGPIYSDGTYLYLTQNEGETSSVKYMGLDGVEEGKFADGKVEGVDAQSGLIAVSSYVAEPYSQSVSLYKGKTLAGTASAAEGMEYAGITSEGAFYVVNDYEKCSSQCYQITPDGKDPVKLGETEAFEYGFPSFEQFLATKDGVYFVISCRDGSAAMVNDVAVYKALPGQENSLTAVELPAEYKEDEPRVPIIYADESGKVGFYDIEPNTPMVGSYEEGGDLLFAYDDNEWTMIKESIIDELKVGDDYYVEQTGEMVDGKFFFIVAAAHRTPDEDIGWRETYGCDSLQYICMDSKGENITELAYLENK